MSFAEFEVFHATPSRWLPIAKDIANSHGLPSSEIEVFSESSNLVVGFGPSHILKIFPPMLRHQHVSERLTLQALIGQLKVEIPEIIFEGERDGWPYLVLSRLYGRTGAEVWPSLTESQKEDLLLEIGALIQEVQSVPATPLLKIEPQWNTFIPKQISGCVERHRRLHLPEKYLSQLSSVLLEAASVLGPCKSPVILTGEYIPVNFMLKQKGEDWTLSGLFDFGDVMTGSPEYDLVGPSTFMCGGKKGRVEHLLRGFGITHFDNDFTKRLLFLFMLHRYSDLNRQIKIERWQESTRDLWELKDLIWPLK